jgi:hypothetical protein
VRARETAGHFRPDCSGNPGARKRDGAAFEQTAHRIVELDLGDSKRTHAEHGRTTNTCCSRHFLLLADGFAIAR